MPKENYYAVYNSGMALCKSKCKRHQLDSFSLQNISPEYFVRKILPVRSVYIPYGYIQ